MLELSRKENFVVLSAVAGEKRAYTHIARSAACTWGSRVCVERYFMTE